MDKKELLARFKKLEKHVAAFIKAAPEFDGDADLAGEVGTAMGELHILIRDIETDKSNS